ncbi:MAG: 3'(2'),5'-bisphosphate nucleotidase [Acidobacteriota bacterium]
MNRLAPALDAVRLACTLTQRAQAELVSEETIAKKDRSPVTVADFAVQALISRHLRSTLPQDSILGEESADFLRSAEGSEVRRRVVQLVNAASPAAAPEEAVTEEAVLEAIGRCNLEGATGSFWTLDPIDGTKGFLRRGQYAIALAWIEEGEVTLGILGCPELPHDPQNPEGPRGLLFAAQRGQGTRVLDLDGRVLGPAEVSQIEDPAAAVFCESVEAAHSAHELHAAIAGHLGVTAPPVRMDSQAKYAALARAEGSIYLRLPRDESYQEKIWDHAAGSLVVEEAGGQVSDAQGRPLDFSVGRTLANNVGIIASNGRFHQRIVDAVAKALTENSKD